MKICLHLWARRLLDSFAWKCQDTKGKEKGFLCLFCSGKRCTLTKVSPTWLCLKAESLTFLSWLRLRTKEQRQWVCSPSEPLQKISALYSKVSWSGITTSWAATSKTKSVSNSTQAKYNLHPLSPFFFFFNYLFIYLWLCWVFVSVRGLSLVVAGGGHSSSWCVGLSLSWPLLLRSTGSRRAGSVIVAHGPSCSTACGILPDQGSNPCPLHWQADSQPLRHQGSPHEVLFKPHPEKVPSKFQ